MKIMSKLAINGVSKRQPAAAANGGEMAQSMQLIIRRQRTMAIGENIWQWHLAASASMKPAAQLS